MVRRKTFNKEGIRYKRRDSVASHHRGWSGKDVEFRGSMNFAKMMKREFKKTLPEYEFKELAYKNLVFLIIKRDTMLGKFPVPYIDKKNWRAFILEVTSRIKKSYNIFLEENKNEEDTLYDNKE